MCLQICLCVHSCVEYTGHCLSVQAKKLSHRGVSLPGISWGASGTCRVEPRCVQLCLMIGQVFLGWDMCTHVHAHLWVIRHHQILRCPRIYTPEMCIPSCPTAPHSVGAGPRNCILSKCPVSLKLPLMKRYWAPSLHPHSTGGETETHEGTVTHMRLVRELGLDGMSGEGRWTVNSQRIEKCGRVTEEP